MNDTITIWAALLSAIAAIFALWLSSRANRIAQKSLELAQKQDIRRRPNLELYIADTYFKRIEDNQFRLYVFHIRISNNSEASNSVQSIELIIDGENHEQKGMHTKVVLTHHDGLATHVPNSDVKPIKMPTPIRAYNTLDGYVLFRLENIFTQEFDIDSYLLSISDIQGFKSQIEPILIREKK